MKYLDEQGYKIKGRKLGHWKPMIEEWLTLINRYCTNIEDGVNNIVQELIKTSRDMDYDVLAWIFPSNKRFLSHGGQYKNTYYPGIILLVKVVD